ncbi:MAG TPA: chaperone modulator CbpM [Planctomycetota bacterium]|nr:chaperone modulator CbpM [Planctomycetota bacterium]
MDDDALLGEALAGATFAFDDVCAVIGATREELLELVAVGAIEPLRRDREHARWLFSQLAYLRAWRALRLQRDLGVNAAGAALALDLLDEIAALRRAAGAWVETSWEDPPRR